MGAHREKNVDQLVQSQSSDWARCDQPIIVGDRRRVRMRSVGGVRSGQNQHRRSAGRDARRRGVDRRRVAWGRHRARGEHLRAIETGIWMILVVSHRRCGGAGGLGEETRVDLLSPRVSAAGGLGDVVL